MSRLYKDESIFQGWKEFDTPTGHMRAEYNGCSVWSLYAERGNAFVHCARVAAKEHISCKRLYDLI